MVQSVVVARKKYLPHPVDKDWLKMVNAELAKRGRGAQAALQRYIVSRGIKCSSGQLADVLSPDVETHTSVFVGPIHEFFEWEPPIPPLLAIDVGEMRHLAERVDPSHRGDLAVLIDALTGASGPEAQHALENIIPLLRRKDETR